MSPFIVRAARGTARGASSDEDDAARSAGSRAKDYMDSFINPPEYLEAQQKKKDEEAKRQKRRFPEQPERDVLLFLHRARAARALAARRPRDRARRGLLLRAAGA